MAMVSSLPEPTPAGPPATTGSPIRTRGDGIRDRPGHAALLALVARRPQVLRRDHDAGGHAGLGGLAPHPGVVGLLVADLAVDLQHAVVVAEHVVRDRPGVGVLQVGVDVHLDDAVLQGLVDLLDRGAGAAVEDEVEGGDLAVLLAHRLLEVLEDARAQHHVARLVDAVHVAEGGGQQVAAVLAQADGLDGAVGVVDGGVEGVVDLVRDAVLLTAGRGDLHLQDDLGLDRLGQQFLGDGEVVVQVLRGAVPHVGLEQRVAARGHPLLGDLQQRADVAVQLVLGTVVGVQRDGDRVLLGDDVRELGERDRARHHVLAVLAAQELRAACGDLDDAVALRLCQPAQRGVQRLRGGDVDGRVGELAGLRPVEHVAVGLGGCDGHRVRSSCFCGLYGCWPPVPTWYGCWYGCCYDWRGDVIVVLILPDSNGYTTSPSSGQTMAPGMFHVKHSEGRKTAAQAVGIRLAPTGRQARSRSRSEYAARYGRPAPVTFASAPRSTITATATTSPPASRTASTAVSGEPPVVEVSSTTSTRRPLTSGPSIRRWRPCVLLALRTTNASSRRPRAAAACSIEPATGSAPRVRPPTAS